MDGGGHTRMVGRVTVGESLTAETTSGNIVAYINSNDGFGIGLLDGSMLSSPLPLLIPIGATGTEFDEAISSLSIQTEPLPEPHTLLLVGTEDSHLG